MTTELTGAESLRIRVAETRRNAAEYVAKKSVEIRSLARRYQRELADCDELRREVKAIEAWCEAALAEYKAAIENEKEALAVFEPQVTLDRDEVFQNVPDKEELMGRMNNPKQTHRSYEHVRDPGSVPDDPKAGQPGKNWRYNTPTAKKLAQVVEEQDPGKERDTDED